MVKYEKKIFVFVIIFIISLIIIALGIGWVVKNLHSSCAYTSGLIPPRRGSGTIISTDELNYKIVVNADMDEKLTLILPISDGIKYSWDELKQGTSIIFLYFQKDYDSNSHSVVIFSYELNSSE